MLLLKLSQGNEGNDNAMTVMNPATVDAMFYLYKDQQGLEAYPNCMQCKCLKTYAATVCISIKTKPSGTCVEYAIKEGIVYNSTEMMSGDRLCGSADVDEGEALWIINAHDDKLICQGCLMFQVFVNCDSKLDLGGTYLSQDNHNALCREKLDLVLKPSRDLMNVRSYDYLGKHLYLQRVAPFPTWSSNVSQTTMVDLSECLMGDSVVAKDDVCVMSMLDDTPFEVAAKEGEAGSSKTTTLPTPANEGEASKPSKKSKAATPSKAVKVGEAGSSKAAPPPKAVKDAEADKPSKKSKTENPIPSDVIEFVKENFGKVTEEVADVLKERFAAQKCLTGLKKRCKEFVDMDKKELEDNLKIAESQRAKLAITGGKLLQIVSSNKAETYIRIKYDDFKFKYCDKIINMLNDALHPGQPSDVHDKVVEKDEVEKNGRQKKSSSKTEKTKAALEKAEKVFRDLWHLRGILKPKDQELLLSAIKLFRRRPAVYKELLPDSEIWDLSMPKLKSKYFRDTHEERKRRARNVKKREEKKALQKAEQARAEAEHHENASDSESGEEHLPDSSSPSSSPSSPSSPVSEE